MDEVFIRQSTDHKNEERPGWPLPSSLHPNGWRLVFPFFLFASLIRMKMDGQETFMSLARVLGRGRMSLLIKRKVRLAWPGHAHVFTVQPGPTFAHDGRR